MWMVYMLEMVVVAVKEDVVGCYDGLFGYNGSVGTKSQRGREEIEV
jgi:hypothetical protein